VTVLAMNDEPSPWRALGSLATVGITLVVATALATIGGYFLDRWLGTNPVFTLIGLGVGIATGFRDFFRAIKRWDKEGRDGQ
jgi:ATP synthase protein I